ncbi:hypothetical protein [Leptotrichia alba]|uniref:Uncharacterized protein n=1 Tax=Leptotrichia alba TaxID=3239304 RepID=A0AB39V4V2_9FUSO
MKSKLFNRIVLFLMFLMVVFSVRADKKYSSGIGDHLMSLYEYPVKGYEKYGKINRIRYKGDYYDPVNYPDHGIKFVVHQDGVRVKVEQVEYIGEDNGSRYETLGTLFEISPLKGKLYAFDGVLPEGAATQRMTVEYKGKKIKYYLDYGSRLIMTDEEEGPEDTEVVELFSGDEGDRL